MRIYITGPGWSGKSTLATRLGTHLNIPVVHMDELQWEKWWVKNKNYKELQAVAVANDAWIIDGCSVSILKTMKDRVDVVVLLNHPPISNVVRVIKRYLRGKFLKEKRIGWSMPDVNEIHLDFLLNTLRWRKRQLPRIRENIKNCSLSSKIIEMKSPENMFEKVILKIKNLN